MKRVIAFVIILITLCVILFPYSSNEKKLENEVKILASSYLIFIKDVCPNASSVSKIKDKYLQSIPESKVETRQWVNENFTKVFIDECLRLEQQK